MAVLHNLTRFHKNYLKTFCAILLMDKDTHTQKTGAWVTALADIPRLTTAITSFWFLVNQCTFIVTLGLAGLWARQ